MGFWGLLALAVALAMDAFAVAVVTALALETIGGRHLFRLSFHFGLFQAAMLAAGWLFGSAASGPLLSVDHWIACVLLAFVGARMILNAFHGGPQAVVLDRTRGWDLVLLSVAPASMPSPSDSRSHSSTAPSSCRPSSWAASPPRSRSWAWASAGVSACSGASASRAWAAASSSPSGCASSGRTSAADRPAVVASRYSHARSSEPGAHARCDRLGRVSCSRSGHPDGHSPWAS